MLRRGLEGNQEPVQQVLLKSRKRHRWKAQVDVAIEGQGPVIRQRSTFGGVTGIYFDNR